MRQAYQELEKGDRLQASEKAWGAVAHRLKVVADSRSLPYENHLQSYAVQQAIQQDAPDPERMETLFIHCPRPPPELLRRPRTPRHAP